MTSNDQQFLRNARVKILNINDRHFFAEEIARDLGIASKVTPPLPNGDNVVSYTKKGCKFFFNS